MTELESIQAGWDQAARDNAFFNIITIPGLSQDEFWRRGAEEIGDVMARLNPPIKRHRALDFGCGIGRLTQALAAYYRRVDGVDISPEMVDQARRFNTHGDRCVYHVNQTEDLSLFDDGRFDFVYSNITLQHMPRELQRGYVTEFFRVLGSGGLAVFEMPDGPDYAHPHEWLSMYGVPRKDAERWIAEDGGTLVDVELIQEPSQWMCYRYAAVKP